MGYHGFKSFENGFYPISLVELVVHASQKLKNLNNQHFFPAVLNLISSPKAIKHDEALWLHLIRLPFFGMYSKYNVQHNTNKLCWNVWRAGR